MHGRIRTYRPLLEQRLTRCHRQTNLKRENALAFFRLGSNAGQTLNNEPLDNLDLGLNDHIVRIRKSLNSGGRDLEPFALVTFLARNGIERRPQFCARKRRVVVKVPFLVDVLPTHRLPHFHRSVR